MLRDGADKEAVMAGENENPTGENEDAEDQDTGDDDGDQDGEDDAYVPPTKEDHQRMVRTLAKRKEERDAARRELAAARKATGSGKGAGTGDGDSEDDTSEPKGDPDAKVKRLAGIAALTSEGMTRDQARVAVRLLDLSGVTVDDDGDADLEDEVADLKAQFPAMFAREAAEEEPRPRVRPRTSGGRSKDTGGTQSADDRTSARLLKAAGYR